MTGRMLLLDELERIVRNCCRMFGMLRDEHLGFSPGENMRSLRELANHLSQVPAVDLAILRGGKQEEIQALERAKDAGSGKDWAETMELGRSELHRYMERLTLDEFENASGTAFYGRTQTNAQWLLEIVTHIYHHRAQLFVYMKLCGYAVDTSTLYS